MKILIGITSKNRCQILPKAIESALSQSYNDKEIWVYDDASEDDTATLKSKYTEINWILSDVQHGYLYARNLFMKKRDFDFFCSLDDDAWLLNPEAIEKALVHMIANPKIGAIGFDMLSPDNSEKKTNNPHFIPTNNFIGCGHVINLKAAKDIGFYTVNPGYYGGEEKDFCIRLIDKGYDIVTYKGMYVWHDKTNIARNLAKQHESGICNDLVFIYRRAPLPILLPSIIVKIAKHFKFAISYNRGSLFMPFIKGLKSFIIWLFKFNTNRKPVSFKAFNTFIRLARINNISH